MNLLLALAVAASGENFDCSRDAVQRALIASTKGCSYLTLVIGYPPGGNTDLVGRHFMAYLGRVLDGKGPSSIVESVPGASGEIASRRVSGLEEERARCNWLVAQSNQMSTNQLGIPNALDPFRDLKALSMLGEAPLVLAVNPLISPHRSVNDLKHYLLSHVDGADRRDFYGSNGLFATDHLATEVFLHEMGAKGTHVPHRGSMPMIQAITSPNRQLDFAFLSIALIRDYLEAGTLYPLGVAQEQELAFGAVRVEPIHRTVPGFVNASMWVALAGAPSMPRETAAAAQHAAACFAQDSQAKAMLTDKFLFRLGGGERLLRAKMAAETAASRERLGHLAVSKP